MIYAITNIEITNNVLAEFVGGYALANKPIANMIFKSYGYIATAQAVQFSADLKLGHYMKVPPRLMFWAQVYATIWGALVSIGVNDWQLTNISGICEEDQPNKFSCPGKLNNTILQYHLLTTVGSHTFFSASVIWGAIGPKRMYGSGGIYNVLEYGFLIGLLLPIPFYFLAKRYPTSLLRYVQIPLVIAGALNLAPYNWSYMWPSLQIGAVFWLIKRRYLGWWQKYAYVLSGAMTVGVAISAVVIFFSLQYVAKDVNWWGNEVSYAGVDGGGSANACVLLPVPAEGYFT